MEVDVRLVELKYELWDLERFQGIVEKEIEFLPKREALQTMPRLQLAGITKNDPEYDIAWSELSHLVYKVVPRYYRCPFLMAVWSVFEYGIQEVGRHLAQKKGVRLRLDDIWGRTLRDRWTKYFRDLLQYDLQIDEAEWTHLNEIQDLRNALAHGNGRIGAVRESLSRKVDQWAREQRGIDLEAGFILLSREYVEEARSLIATILLRLISRLEKDL